MTSGRPIPLRMHPGVFATALALLLFRTSIGLGFSRFWVGKFNNLGLPPNLVWEDAGCWENSILPAPGDDVFFLGSFNGRSISLRFHDEILGSMTIGGGMGEMYGFDRGPWSFNTGAPVPTPIRVLSGNMSVLSATDATINVPFSTDVGLTKIGGGALTLTGDNSLGGTSVVQEGTLDLNGQTTINGGLKVLRGASLKLSGNTRFTGDLFVDGSSVTITGPTHFDSGLTVLNATAQISSPCTFTGDVRVQKDGVLMVDGDDRLGASSNVLRIDGGTLAATDSFATSRNVVLGGAGGGEGIISVDAGKTLTVSSSLSGYTLVKAGAGTLALGSANSYHGVTRVLGGTLQLSGPSLLGPESDPDLTGQSVLSIGSGGTFDLGGANRTIGALKDDVTGGGGTVQLGSSTLTVGTLGASTSYSGIIAGTGGLALSPPVIPGAAPGTLNLSGNNTFTGGITANAGTLHLSGPQSFTGGVIANKSATVITDSPASLGRNAVTLAGGTLRVGGGGYSASITLSPDGGTVYVAAAAYMFADISGPGGLMVSGAGKVYQTGNYISDGPLTVDGGTLILTGRNGTAQARTINVIRGGVLGCDDSQGNTTYGYPGLPPLRLTYIELMRPDGQVALDSGTLSLIGASYVDSYESLQRLVLLGGESKLMVQAGSEGTAEWNLFSLSQQSPNGLLDVEGLQLGGTEKVFCGVTPAGPGGLMPYWLTVNGQPAYNGPNGLTDTPPTGAAPPVPEPESLGAVAAVVAALFRRSRVARSGVGPI